MTTGNPYVLASGLKVWANSSGELDFQFPGKDGAIVILKDIRDMKVLRAILDAAIHEHDARRM